MSLVSLRLATIIQRELVVIINEFPKDGSIGYINITAVDVTKDLSYAYIYYTILNDKEQAKNAAKAFLDEKNATIRMQLAKKIKDSRKIPTLVFKYDVSLETGNRIEKLLEEAK